MQWLFGLGISLVIGAIVTYPTLKILQCISLKRTKGKLPSDLGVPNWLTGLLERLFFTVIVAFDVSGAAVAMVAWLGLKMASNWHQISKDRVNRGLGLAALLTGIVSLLFALIGGLVWKGDLPKLLLPR